jgi:hypothetical protein
MRGDVIQVHENCCFSAVENLAEFVLVYEILANFEFVKEVPYFIFS